MTTITDSDIKDIKDAIFTLTKQVTELGKQINDVEKNLTQKINDVEKNLTQKINDVEKNLTVKLSEVSGDLKTTNAKIDGLDKRITTLEFFYRAISLGLFGLFAAAILKYYFDHPFN